VKGGKIHEEVVKNDKIDEERVMIEKSMTEGMKNEKSDVRENVDKSQGTKQFWGGGVGGVGQETWMD